MLLRLLGIDIFIWEIEFPPIFSPYSISNKSLGIPTYILHFFKYFSSFRNPQSQYPTLFVFFHFNPINTQPLSEIKLY